MATHSVQASWVASTDTVDGYNLLRGTVSGGPYTKVNSSLITGTSFVDSGPFNAGLGPYFYVAESVKGSVSSINSNEATVLLPPAPPTALTVVDIG